MSPALSRSSVIQCFECSDVLNICYGIILDFYPGLPHMLLKCLQEILFLNAVKLHVQFSKSRQLAPCYLIAIVAVEGGKKMGSQRWWRRDLLGTTSSHECTAEYTTVDSRETITATLTHLCSALWTGWCLVAVC